MLFALWLHLGISKQIISNVTLIHEMFLEIFQNRIEQGTINQLFDSLDTFIEFNPRSERNEMMN